MTYIDGFVTPPTADRETYRAFADRTARLLLDHGALRVVEAWGDDVPDGTRTDFRRAVGGAPGDAVAFSFVEWPDRATRDAGMAAVMDDPRMADVGAMPFDGTRMIYGGFDAIVDVRPAD